MTLCRECRHEISEHAVTCPQCGAPCAAQEKWDGWGYKPNRMPVPAKGVIAIGQFACGIFTLSQFGIGVVSISQFTVAGYALAQFAIAYSLIAQLGIYIHQGQGQLVTSLSELMGMLF